jgi:hypothetical protein
MPQLNFFSHLNSPIFLLEFSFILIKKEVHKSNQLMNKYMEMLGQPSTAVTKHYLDSFDQEQIPEINNFLS